LEGRLVAASGALDVDAREVPGPVSRRPALHAGHPGHPPDRGDSRSDLDADPGITRRAGDERLYVDARTLATDVPVEQLIGVVRLGVGAPADAALQLVEHAAPDGD